MDSAKEIYAKFPFEWTIKSTSCHILYRIAFNINEIDEILCSIINAKGNKIYFSELGILLGFNLQDLAEIDILKNYLNGLSEYNLITVSEKEQKIQLTEFGDEAIQSKLKYKYYFANTELFENQTATGEYFDFSFKNVFNIENHLTHGREYKEQILEKPDLKQKIQFQLFGNDIYKGEIVELYESEPRTSYKTISLHCEITELENLLELSIIKSGVKITEVQNLLELPENAEFKTKLIRQGKYHHILSAKHLITKQDIETYDDLWNWKELAGNSKLDWNDNTIFELFRDYGDGGIWSIISEKAPIEIIQSVIDKYAGYWNWATLTERFDDDFIKKQIEAFDWDFEELSYKEVELVTSLLSNLNLKEKGWDWNYLSKNLPNKFIEDNIEDFPWDFYIITESKNEVFKNTFFKYRNKLETLILKNWNWKIISEEININFLHKNITVLASKLNWSTVLNRFFINEEITTRCLNEESFKSILKQHLPKNFVVAHQKYLWTLYLIDFFENLNLIQWETQKFINGFDTNENVEWNKPIFQKYHNRIISQNGFLNVSKQISDYSLINEFPEFAWNWEGISHNKKLISNSTFIRKAFIGELSYSNNLLWNEILLQSIFDISFWNKNLEAFYNTTESEKQAEFWKALTRKENSEYIFANKHFPWDWCFITENSSEKAILDSYDDDELFEKWDWKVATRKIDKDTILERLEDISQYVDWKYLINNVFTIENELAIDKQLQKIAECLSVLESDKCKEYWKDISYKIPFETLFPIVQETIQLYVFEWDWDFISNHILFPTDIRTLNQFKEKINWTIFTESYAIKQKFNPDSWDNYNQWLVNVDRYLNQFKEYWNWQVLSKNSNINKNRYLLNKYIDENWDWNYLTEFGRFLLKSKKDTDYYLEKLVIQFPKIKFEILSKRIDVKISSNLIISNKDENWDWQLLSENENSEVTFDLILQLKNKNWNWVSLSKRKNIELSNEVLLQLLDKNWNWNYLSQNEYLKFDAEFIAKTNQKPWNWKLVSRHKSFLPSVEILSLTKDYDIDWEHISNHSRLSLNKENLAKFENKWHWRSITKNPQIDFDDIDLIERFADKWNWRFICESGKMTFNYELLNKFKDYIDWNLISSNTNINFTIEIINEFKQFWNWTYLKNNKRIEDLKLTEFVNESIKFEPILYFVDKITEKNSRWKECVYHFTNIDNAVKILNEGKIKSRHYANQLSNSSGILTHKTRKDPEVFARFYFRTSTPTQYYNEGLFFPNTEERYRDLGYPKCPKMIYFKASLQEILFKNKDFNNIYLSNGNMQRNNTKYGILPDMINLFYYDELFTDHISDNGYPSQQELMFETDVSISNLSSLKVVCECEYDRQLIKRMLGNNANNFEIEVDSTLYEGVNDKPIVQINAEEVKLSSNYNQEGYFTVTFENFIPNIIDGDIIKINKIINVIYFKSFISFSVTFQDFKIHFFEEIENIEQIWTIATQSEFKYENNKLTRHFLHL